MGQFTKRWEDLEFSDNYIFCKVMHNENLCRQLLEILLGIKIKKINYLETEKPIERFYDKRGIRMDVFLEDSNRVFDIEMQTGNYDDIILRSRYYQSSADVSTTPRRALFRELKETWVIFICKKDPFGEGLPVYTKQTKFAETDNIPYDDKTNNVFYNSSAYEKVENEEIRDVLKFIYKMQAQSDFTKQLETSVIETKIQSNWKEDYMTVQEAMDEDIAEEVEKRVSKITKEIASRVEKEVTSRVEKEVTSRVEKEVTSRVEKEVTSRVEREVTSRVEKEIADKAIADEKIKTAKKMLALKTFTIEQIASVVNLSEEEITALE